MKKQIALFVLIIFCSYPLIAQKKAPAKYPSLFWEITGNGLKKPSYLFGTMHVSSKMAFHLSDSFYYAIKNVDAVALELNPDIWQGQMVRLAKMQENYAKFFTKSGNDFLNEESFRIKKFEEELKLAMSTEPTVVNSLLYRSYSARQDFEEDTFLDLYIFQTGRKLGKRATGVEDYYETEKIVMQAYTDMAKEKKKKTVDTDGETYYEIESKIQEAYKRGDLDLMDSLDRMIEKSDAFREKFLYKRNEIQANSIDTILKKSSLFVGVGAAHLAGDKGVIEYLRKKGYKLRPIKMLDRDALQKDVIDKGKVAVNFNKQMADDGFYELASPGTLYNLSTDYSTLDRRQYSDMSNGSYYLVTRVKTHAAFLQMSDDVVLQKIDSLLYENIPGKIITKKTILKNGYKGYDILNKTRRGDLQRYQIIVTPFEVLFFKMSGKENYIEGVEGNQFFSSIQLKEFKPTKTLFSPAHGEFNIEMPHTPFINLNTTTQDGVNRWEYEAVDKTNNDAYVVFKKSINNVGFLDEDTFDLSLIENSFFNEDFFDKQTKRSVGYQNGYNYLDVKTTLKNGSAVYARHIIKGPHYYTLAVTTKNNNKSFSSFFNSFKFLQNNYNASSTYIDTFMHFTVQTPVKPMIDEDMRAMIYKSAKEIEEANIYSAYNSYWLKTMDANFENDSTGEKICVSVQQLPKYYFVKDSAKYWVSEVEDYYKDKMILVSKDSSLKNSAYQWYSFTLQDTASSRTIYRKLFLKDNYTYSIVSLGDTAISKSSFITNFYNSFTPSTKKMGESIYKNKVDTFFNDLLSKDSARHTQAFKAINSIYFGEKDAPLVINAINKLNIGNRNYFETKANLIEELGYIKDTTKPIIVAALKTIYDKTADTSIFQNEVFNALVRHKTKESYALLKELLLQDPPVVDESYGASTVIENLDDSLLLTKSLFPELLQLTSLDDYKQPILSLLVTLVDSNILKAVDYENYFSKIYFDAKIELKKQQAKDEKRVEGELKKKENGNEEDEEDSYYERNYNGNSTLFDYCVLLLPYYDKNVNVQKFFEKLLKSKDPLVRLNSTISLLRGSKKVDDSVIVNLAADDKYRMTVFNLLQKNKLADKFPVQYKTQLAITKSCLVIEKEGDKFDSISFVKKEVINYKGKKGWVYFYKYRHKKEDDWKMALCGLQPLNEKEVSNCDDLILFSDKKIKKDEPMLEQFSKQLKKILIASHDSGKYFYNENGNYNQYLKGVGY